MLKNPKKSPLLEGRFGPTFGVFGYCRREDFDTLKSFCYFWALDMAPTYADPGLLMIALIFKSSVRIILKMRSGTGMLFRYRP